MKKTHERKVEQIVKKQVVMKQVVKKQVVKKTVVKKTVNKSTEEEIAKKWEVHHESLKVDISKCIMNLKTLIEDGKVIKRIKRVLRLYTAMENGDSKRLRDIKQILGFPKP